MRYFLRYLALSLSAILLLTCCNFKSQHADLIIHNAVGLVCDGTPINTTKIAIAIENGKIVAVGPERKILNAYMADEKIDRSRLSFIQD